MTNTRTITSVTSPQWADNGHTQILCQVTTAEMGGPYPFGAMANDTTSHGKQLWTDLNNGRYGTIAAYVPPVLPPTPVTIKKA